MGAARVDEELQQLDGGVVRVPLVFRDPLLDDFLNWASALEWLRFRRWTYADVLALLELAEEAALICVLRCRCLPRCAALRSTLLAAALHWLKLSYFNF